jgi:hypothetical protein
MMIAMTQMIMTKIFSSNWLLALAVPATNRRSLEPLAKRMTATNWRRLAVLMTKIRLLAVPAIRMIQMVRHQEGQAAIQTTRMERHQGALVRTQMIRTVRLRVALAMTLRRQVAQMMTLKHRVVPQKMMTKMMETMT